MEFPNWHLNMSKRQWRIKPMLIASGKGCTEECWHSKYMQNVLLVSHSYSHQILNHIEWPYFGDPLEWSQQPFQNLIGCLDTCAMSSIELSAANSEKQSNLRPERAIHNSLCFCKLPTLAQCCSCQVHDDQAATQISWESSFFQTPHIYQQIVPGRKTDIAQMFKVAEVRQSSPLIFFRFRIGDFPIYFKPMKWCIVITVQRADVCHRVKHIYQRIRNCCCTNKNHQVHCIKWRKRPLKAALIPRTLVFLENAVSQGYSTKHGGISAPYGTLFHQWNNVFTALLICLRYRNASLQRP